MTRTCSRRLFLAHLGMGAYLSGSDGTLWSAQTTSDRNRPNITSGVASGDVTTDSAILWSRTDRPARMIVDVSTRESFADSRRVVGPDALEVHDYTAKLRLRDLPPGERIFYRVRFQDLSNRRRLSAPVAGQLVLPPPDDRDITFLWSGDTAGQGYGIDPARGGMLTYDTMRRLTPDFFVHSGDNCYADNPFPAQMRLEDGSLWNNVTTAETAKVAETLDEFRANYRYNLLDAHVRQFHAQVPVFAQWDDHETTNNWYPGEQLLEDDRYTVKSASLLAARARQAFCDYLPIRTLADARPRIERVIHYGPRLDLFFLDLRSYRGPNSRNAQTEPGSDTAFLGQGQLQWLKRQLLASRATWKVICSDMPIGLIVRDGPDHYENGANGDGLPSGRELELAELLKFVHDNHIGNVVWLTADVHYAASHYYDPSRARFPAFTPFWEFVSGPLPCRDLRPQPTG